MLINQKAVKLYALDVAKQTRSHPFTRVSSELLGALDMKLKNTIEDWVQRHPSKGSTLYPSA